MSQAAVDRKPSIQADDLETMFAGLGSSQDRFDAWYREQTREFHCIDIEDGVPSSEWPGASLRNCRMAPQRRQMGVASELRDVSKRLRRVVAFTEVRRERLGRSCGPDNSQNLGNGASRPSLPAMVARAAATRDPPALVGREVRLGVALAGLAQDLPAARREIAVLKRENAALRSQLELGGAR